MERDLGFGSRASVFAAGRLRASFTSKCLFFFGSLWTCCGVDRFNLLLSWEVKPSQGGLRCVTGCFSLSSLLLWLSHAQKAQLSPIHADGPATILSAVL